MAQPPIGSSFRSGEHGLLPLVAGLCEKVNDVCSTDFKKNYEFEQPRLMTFVQKATMKAVTSLFFVP